MIPPEERQKVERRYKQGMGRIRHTRNNHINVSQQWIHSKVVAVVW